MKKNILIILLFCISASLWAADSVTCRSAYYQGQEIVCLKKGYGKTSLDERVHLVERRIERLAEDLSLDPHDIAVTSTEAGFNINIKDFDIMTLGNDDIDISHENLSKEVDVIAGRLKALLVESRESKGLRILVRGGIFSAIATIILILVFYAFSKFFPRLYSLIEVEGKRIPSVKIQNWEVLNSQRLVSFILWMGQVGRTILTLLALYIYVPLILSFFPQTAPMAPTIFNFVANPLKEMLHKFIGFIPNFFIIIVIGIITGYALKLVRFFFDEIEKGNIEFKGFYRDWAAPSYMLVRVLVIAFSLVVIFPYIPGSSSSAFKGVSVFFGVLISLGSSSSIANVVAGIVITYMRPFRLGDLVKVNDTMGVVTEKNLLVTRVRTNKNIDITVPNSMILGSHIVNYSNNADTQGLILPVRVDFGYEIPWQKVHKMLLEASRRTELVLENPEPFVWHKTLNDHYVSYELNVYIRNAPLMGRIQSDLHRNIQDVSNENGVELLSPIYSAIRDGNEKTLPESYRSEMK